jgi:protein SCO1/2
MCVRVRSCVIPVLLAAFAAFASCGRREPPAREFELRGQILATGPDNELLVMHEDIKGFMPAMTMPYKVRDADLLRGRRPGDLISATLVVSDTDAWLTRIEKTGTAPLPEPVADTTTRIDLLRPGDVVPDTPLTDDQGHSLALSDWRGSASAITFIYTRCPLPQFCPLMDRRFAEVQQLAKADPALHGRVRLLSVSFDPDADTPAVLRAHASKLSADPLIWRFATAPRDVVDGFANAFGVSVIREQDKTITHNLRTAVIDPEGRLIAVYDGSAWTPEQVVTDMRRSLAK